MGESLLGSLIDQPIHGTVQNKLQNNGGQVATPELQVILAEAQRGLAHLDKDSWLEWGSLLFSHRAATTEIRGKLAILAMRSVEIEA
jgi:hypothetical protein